MSTDGEHLGSMHNILAILTTRLKQETTRPAAGALVH